MPENITPELSEEKQSSESQKDSLKQLAEQKRKAAAKKRRRGKSLSGAYCRLFFLPSRQA